MTFETRRPALGGRAPTACRWDDAVVETFLTLLAARARHAHRAPRRAATARRACRGWRATALAAGGVRSDAGRRAIDDMDRALRDARNTANPGTTADLTAAAIFVVLLELAAQLDVEPRVTVEDCDAATR